MAEDCRCGVAVVSVDELVRDYTVSVEGLSVYQVGVGHSGIGGGVVPLLFSVRRFVVTCYIGV